jgi:hypothetical protein
MARQQDRFGVRHCLAPIETLGIDPAARGLTKHRETIDIIGDVKLWLRGVEDEWQDENEKICVQVTWDDAYPILEIGIAATRGPSPPTIMVRIRLRFIRGRAQEPPARSFLGATAAS